ncbi:hypothetical protein [Thermoanaerobacterium thermosaccharolyticum]|nr:hypothetical protein [Thermoanaerobacterium thermosaccharolyticum]
MEEAISFLKANPVLYLASIERDSKPKVIPFQCNLSLLMLDRLDEW